MPKERDRKNELLRRYFEQNGISCNQPKGIELDRLKMSYNSPADFKRAVLEWETEQREFEIMKKTRDTERQAKLEKAQEQYVQLLRRQEGSIQAELLIPFPSDGPRQGFREIRREKFQIPMAPDTKKRRIILRD